MLFTFLQDDEMRYKSDLQIKAVGDKEAPIRDFNKERSKNQRMPSSCDLGGGNINKG